MSDWNFIDHEDVPNGDRTLYLMERDGEYAIHVDGDELMTNGQHGSEDALADLACDRLANLDDARVLVGGLGMGFTLAAALRRVGPQGHVTVAELIPAVVRWNEAYLGAAAGFPLRDSRAAVFVGDVGDLVERPPAPWSAILLDVDNGPRALTTAYNGWLYSPKGLSAAFDALIPGGVLAVWSAHTDGAFTKRLRKARFEVEVARYNEAGRPTPDRSGTHVLWMAVRPR